MFNALLVVREWLKVGQGIMQGVLIWLMFSDQIHRVSGRRVRFYASTNITLTKNAIKREKKAVSTRRGSQAVPDPSTNRALRRLTSEFGRDPVFST